MTSDSLPPFEMNASTDEFEAGMTRARAVLDIVRGWDVGVARAALDILRDHDAALDTLLILEGDPTATDSPRGILADPGRYSTPHPAKFVLPADRLRERPLGEFVALARRRDGDGWATVKRY